MNLTDALGWTLVHFLWQGTLIALLHAAVAATLCRRSAKARYAAACLGLLLMALTPVATFLWLQAGPDAAVTAQLPAAIAMEIPTAVLPSAAVELPNQLRDFFPRMIALWLAGVSVVSIWYVFGWFGVLRLKRRGTRPAPDVWRQRLETLALRMGIRRRIRLLESTLVRVPSVVGLFRPAVLIPASAFLNLPTQYLEALLVHELAHVLRHDYLVNLLQTVVETVLFYHPAVWWTSHRIRVEREHCCDDVAVAVCGDRLTYARALTGLEEMRLGDAAYAMAANGASLIARIRRLTLGREAGGPTRGSWILTALPLLVALTMWASPSFIDQDSPQPVPEQPEPARPAEPASRPAPAKKKVAAVAAAQPAPATPAIPVTPVTPKGSGLLAALSAAGYGDLSVDEIVNLKVQGITGEYLIAMRNAGFGRISPALLIDLHVQGVSPDYVRQMHESGIRDLTVRQIIDLRIQSVNPRRFAEIHSLGFGPYTAREAIDLTVQGVPADLFRALKDNGFTQIDAREAIEAQLNGLRASDLRKACDYGPQLSLKKILKLKQAGVL